MSSIFPRSIGAILPRAVNGEGCYIIDDQGKRYLDASGGAAVSCLGHSDLSVIDAISEQSRAIAFAHTGFFTSEPAESLAEILIKESPGDMSKVYFLSGGSEAVEAALKLARQFMVERGEPERRHFVARWQSYHGNTLGGLSVGGNKKRREIYEPILLETEHIDPCFAYRWKNEGETDESYGYRAADQLRKTVEKLGPNRIIAFIAETVVGATAGAVPAVPGYFRQIRDICDEFGILLILDEVMCGMGRTGTLFAYEQEGILPDIVTVAKGLGAGYQPIGAVLCREHIFNQIASGTGEFQHGHTYMGHPVACAAAVAVQNRIRKDNLLDNVIVMGERLKSALFQTFSKHPYVGDIRGRGLFWAIEFVSDRGTKTPFDPSLKLHARIKKRAIENGLICYPSGGTLDGFSGDHVLLAPPFTVKSEEIDEATRKLGDSVQQVFKETNI